MATTVLGLENKNQAADAIEEEKADPPFQGIKNELEGMIALFKEIVSKWDSSEASKKNDEANLLSQQSSEGQQANPVSRHSSEKNDEANPLSQQSSQATKKNDEANPLSRQSSQATKKNDEANPLSRQSSEKNDEANPLSQQSSQASEKNDEANPLSRQSSQASEKNDEANPLSRQSSQATKKNDNDKANPLALCCKWIKKKKLKAPFEENPLSHQSSEADRKNDEANPLALHSRWSKKKELKALFEVIGSEWDSSLALRSRWIKKKLEKLKALFEGRVSKWEDNLNLNLQDQISALVGEVDNLVLGPYDNDDDKLNSIIGVIQRIRNLVTPGTVLNLEYRILMISEAIQKKEPGNPREGSSFQIIKKELERMTAQFHGKVSKWEDNLLLLGKWEEHLLGQVSALEHDVDNLVSGPDDNDGNRERKLNRIIGDLKLIAKLVSPVRPINIDLERKEYQPEKETSAKKVSQAWQPLDVEDQFFENADVKNLKATIDNLGNFQFCLLFLSIFPDNFVIKKRPLIYWWIGEGLIKAERFKRRGYERGKTAEEVGEEIFVRLMAENLIIAEFDNEWNWSPVVNRCKVHPWIRHMLIFLAKEAQLFVFDSTGTPSCNTTCPRAFLDSKSWDKSDQEAAKLLTVFNLNEGYPSFRDDNWLRKLKNVVALQLGRWQDSVKHHIEMEDELLKGLGVQKDLKYLSLRGISRITTLPLSIVNLTSLEILDLRACHNLEKLPDKIESLKKLTHLDVSECYLLESMPKGLEKLTALQVLKGFVVGDPNETSCRIGSLGKLKNLRRLGIRMGKTAVIREEQFEKLGDIASLRCLTISWVKRPEDEFLSLSFPSNLEKLDLRGIPLKKAPEWLQPSNLTKLKKLYIRGGELNSLDFKNSNNGGTGSWQVEILILKYLEHLKIDLPELQEKFPCLRYLEKIRCHKKDKDIVWYKSEGEGKGKLWTKIEEKWHAARDSKASSSNSR